MKEVIQNAKTVQAAIEAGARELGVDVGRVTHVVLEEPKKGILGIGAADAIVKVIYEETPADKAEEFVKTLLADMGLEAEIRVTPETDTNEDGETREGVLITVNGEGLGVLIGHHGDVLDSLQYLASLAANRGNKEYFRVSVDIENYRAKRKETLEQLAKRMAEKVLKYNRSFALEPMSSYERRIIHTACQNIEGVTTYSVGNDGERKVVVSPDKKSKNPNFGK